MLYKAMAKNVFPKKKRIAHFQMRTDSFTDGRSENELSGCLDYVSSIIKNMDSSFKAMNSDCSKIRAKTKCISNELENSSSNKATSSIHKDLTHNPKNSGKKISMSRKFPLMEKSQKILRQIKHNRNISKPRAHLSSLPKSPAKADIKASNLQKKKEKLKPVNKVKNNPDLCSTTLSDIYVHKSNGINDASFKNNSKISKNVQNVIHKGGECTKSKDLSGYSYNATSKLNMNANFDKNSISDTKDSENETTDSEYERFVKKNKKGLKKKAVKIQKQPTAKKIASIKQSKGRVLRKNTLKRCDSDESDNDNSNDISLSNNSRKVSPFKKCKVAQVQTDTDAEDDSRDTCSALQADSPCDSDSESNAALTDILGNYKNAAHETSCITDDTVPKTYIPNVFSSHMSSSSEVAHETSHIIGDTVPKSYIPIVLSSHGSISPEAAHETFHTTEDTVSKSYTPDVFSSHVSNSLSEAEKIESNCTTSHLVIDLCDSDSDSKIASSIEHSSIFKQREEANTVTDDLIGLFKNNSDCNNTISEKINLDAPKQEKIFLMKDTQKTADKNVFSLDSEESDIEIIDVVPTMSKDKCITDVAPKMLDCSKYVSSDQVVGIDNLSNISNRNSKLVVKTEIDVKNSNVVSAEDNKYEAVYMTNICNDLDQVELVNQSQRTLISSECKELLETSSKDILVDGTVLKKDVKTENESDDDIVILDCVQSKVLPRNVSEFPSSNRVKTEASDVVMESLKCVKYSAHKILKMGNFQNNCENPMIIDGRNTNIKNEQTNTNLSCLQNRYAEKSVLPKIESTFIKDELKLRENMCSSSRALPVNLSGVTYKVNKDYDDLKQMDELHLIELYKKEFETYQEIVQTEATVGASLKLLEVRQAEKVEHIRSLVQKYIATDQVFKENPVNKNSLEDLCPSSSISKTVLASSKLDNDIKPNISGVDMLQNVQLLEQPTVILKQEPRSSEYHLNSSKVESNKKRTLKLLNEKCNVCGKEAMAACQNCAKVFFCSNECGRKFWNNGHINECGK